MSSTIFKYFPFSDFVSLGFSEMRTFQGAMAQWLGHWIPNPGIRYSKPLEGSKVDSAFHPCEVDQISTRTSWERSGKK